MPTARHAAVIAAPVSDLWSLLASLESWPRWMHVPYVSESVRVTSEGPAGPGAEFEMKGRLGSRLFARVTAWEEERRLEYEIYRSEYPSDRLTFGRAVITIVLEPLGPDRTKATCEHRLEGKGLAGRAYAATVMRPLIKANAQRIVDSLAAAGRARGKW